MCRTANTQTKSDAFAVVDGNALEPMPIVAEHPLSALPSTPHRNRSRTVSFYDDSTNGMPWQWAPARGAAIDESAVENVRESVRE